VRNHEDTIRLAHEYLKGGHISDAVAVLAETVNSLPPLVVKTPCDDTDNPDWMCQDCRCWKQFRAVCS
jgi:hypothetical protein